MKNRRKFRNGTLVHHNNSMQIYFIEDFNTEFAFIRLDEGVRGGPSKKVPTCELTRSKRQHPKSWDDDKKKSYRGGQED